MATRCLRGERLNDAALIDVAPTVLRLLGQPIPQEMDGHVLSQALRPEALAGLRTVSLAELGFDGAGGEVSFTDAEAAYVSERLAGLGYLG